MIERRSELRLQACDLVMIFWEGNGTRLHQLANVEDISAGGMKVLVTSPLAGGTPVTITYGDGALSGVVRHGFEIGRWYCMGIEFLDSSKNSTLHFDPELLIWPGYRCDSDEISPADGSD